MAVVSLTSCSVSPTSDGSSPKPATNITGNWELIATSSISGSLVPIGIYFTEQNGSVSGVVNAQIPVPQDCNPCYCGVPFSNINPQLSGTIDSAGNVSLQTVPFTNGTVLTITGKTSTYTTLDSGTYTLAGSGCLNDNGAISGNEIATVNGTYTGTVKSAVTGQTFGVTTTLTQTSTPDAKGFFYLNGTASFTGSSCFTTAAVESPYTQTTYLSGSEFAVEFIPTGTSNTDIATGGSFSPDVKTLYFSYVVTGGNCTNDYGQGTLTLQ